MWKDELKDNRNSYSGELPDGDYDPPNGMSTTKIYYCCRADGVAASNPIYLPTDLPFVLFKSGSHLCQKVEGMQVKSEYFYSTALFQILSTLTRRKTLIKTTYTEKWYCRAVNIRELDTKILP